MGIVVTPYTPELVDAVKAFNARLRAAGAPLTFPESATPEWLPNVDGREIYHDYYLAADNGVVRGAYILKHQPFCVAGKTLQVSQFRLPLSEGQFDRQFAAVGVQLYLDAFRKQKMLYTVGIGGYQEAFAQMLVSAGWKTWTVPFYFRVFRAAPFLRNIVYLRTSPLRRLALDTLALSGLGSLAVSLYQSTKSRRTVDTRGVECSNVESFEAWADEIWEAAQPAYSLIAVRTAEILNILYPASDPRWIRLQVRFEGRVVGWVVALNVPMHDHNYFGNMRVGSLVDCLALPGFEDKVVSAAIRHLQRDGADMIVTNLAHRSWRAAAESNGLCEAASNFIFALSKPVAALLEPFEEQKERVHMTRGDGSGPQNLLEARK
jgi:hypothetical protein